MYNVKRICDEYNIQLQCQYDDETKMITEHFSLFEPGYGLDISFMYDTSDATKFTEAYDVTPFIADSVIRHK